MTSLGNITFNTHVPDSDGIVWYVAVDGWDSLPQRTSTMERPGRHGSVTVRNVFDARQLTLFGTAYCPDGVADFWVAKEKLAAETAFLNPFTDTPLLLTVEEEVDKRLTVYRTSLQTRCIDDRVLSFEATFRADDPFKYAATASTLTTSGSASNIGNALTYPTFTLTANGTPVLSDGTHTWQASSAITIGTVIDFEAMTVYNGATNLFANVALASTWFGLAPGATALTSTVAGTWSWRSAWQ